MSPDREDNRDDFEGVLRSLRRWVAGLGVFFLVLLVLKGVERPILLGYCVGWLLSLFSLDHIGARARSVAEGALSPGDAQKLAAKSFMFRWLVIIVVIVTAGKLGANPVAAVAALLLLQAAVMCRSIASLLRGSDAPIPDGDPDPDGETVG